MSGSGSGSERRACEMTRSVALMLLLAAAGWNLLPVGAAGQVTQQAVQDTSGKRQTLPPLALPDIVILGRDSAMVREGSKLFTSVKRTALEREIGAPLGEKLESRTGLGGGRTFAARDNADPGRQARAYLRGGTFDYLGGAEYWTDLRQWRLVTEAGGAGTREHIDNSAALEGFGRATLIRRLGTNTELRIRAGFSGGRQEEWGDAITIAGLPGLQAAPADAARTWIDGTYGLEFESTLRRGLTFRAGAGGRHTELRDNTRQAPTTLEPGSNGGWADLGLEWVTGRTIFALSGRAEGDGVKGVLPGRTVSLVTSEVSMQTLVGEARNFHLGAVVYQLNDGLSTITRIWPRVSFSSRYSDRFRMYVRYHPAIDYLSLSAARVANPFVANSFTVTPRRERFNLAIGLTYTVAPRIEMEFQVARRIFELMPVWRRVDLTNESNSRGLFMLDGIDSPGLNETRLGLRGDPSERFVFSSEVVLRDVTGGGGIEELPHIPRFEFTGGINTVGPWNIELGAEVIWLGERYGDSAGLSSRRLEPAADLSLRTARKFGDLLTVWLELRNVLDREIVIWEGYPMPGRTTALGISLRF